MFFEELAFAFVFFLGEVVVALCFLVSEGEVVVCQVSAGDVEECLSFGYGCAFCDVFVVGECDDAAAFCADDVLAALGGFYACHCADGLAQEFFSAFFGGEVHFPAHFFAEGYAVAACGCFAGGVVVGVVFIVEDADVVDGEP